MGTRPLFRALRGYAPHRSLAHPCSGRSRRGCTRTSPSPIPLYLPLPPLSLSDSCLGTFHRLRSPFPRMQMQACSPARAHQAGWFPPLSGTRLVFPLLLVSLVSSVILGWAVLPPASLRCVFASLRCACRTYAQRALNFATQPGCAAPMRAHGLCRKHGGRRLCPEPACGLKGAARGRCMKHDLAFNPQGLLLRTSSTRAGLDCQTRT